MRTEGSPGKVAEPRIQTMEELVRGHSRGLDEGMLTGWIRASATSLEAQHQLIFIGFILKPFEALPS